MKTTLRVATRSPVALARTALAAAQAAIPAYSSKYSRKDFTQHQLVACLMLKSFFNTDYRGLIALLQDFSDLRNVLRLQQVPHYSTLCKADKRLGKSTPFSG
jgi:hypothetical protein